MSAFALTEDQKGNILENFKRLEYEMIFESNSSFLDDTDKQILSTSRKINIYSSIWEKVKSKTEYLEAQNAKVVSRIESLEWAIEAIDLNVEKILEEVNRINVDVIETKKLIDKNKLTINLLRKKIVENRRILLEYMIHLYKKWWYVYDDENSIDNIKTILLSWDDMSGVINDLHFKSLIQVTWKSLIDKHRSYISELYIKKTELEKEENKLKALRKAWVIEKKVLSDNKEFKKRLLEETKWQEALYQKYIQDNLEIQHNLKVKELQERIKFNNTREKILEKYNCEFVDVSNEKEKLPGLSNQCLILNKVIYAESRLTWFGDEKNILSWPVSPFGWVTAYFHDEGYSRAFWSEHDAIDIAIPQWTDIVAPADGYVVFLQSPSTPAGYAYIALKHAGEIVTVYGHISDVFVGTSDFVKKWEVFAKTGWQYWTVWAWVLSTWAHLHFEVFSDKEYEDPLKYLDISYLNFSSLPEKYRFKYLADFKERKWVAFQENKSSDSRGAFKIDWNNEIERQKSLLNTYAAPEFKNWDMWIEESIDGNIDPTFMMCLWLAESSLWRSLKTGYNVGNVWNTDSGWTYEFENPRTWIFWIAKTLNNSFLWGYDKISDLSRYGNKTGTIYASSPDHWHNNIVKCMSHVKWEYIPDDYNFRVNQYN